MQVVLRFFNRGFPRAEELARYLMIWAGFLGASLATKQKRHLKVDVLPRLLTRTGQVIVFRLAALISAGFCFFLVNIGYTFVANAFKFGRVSTALGLPIWIVQLGIPLTSLVMACRFLGQALGDIPEDLSIPNIVEMEKDVRVLSFWRSPSCSWYWECRCLWC